MNYFHAFGRNHQNFQVFSAPLPGNLLFRRCGHELYRYLVTPPFLLPPLRAGLPMPRWVSATTHPYVKTTNARSQQSPPLTGRGNRAQMCCHGVFFEDGDPHEFQHTIFRHRALQLANVIPRPLFLTLQNMPNSSFLKSYAEPENTLL
jgi:hypothetical protein